MRRLFLDSNVLFTAAHNPKGKAAFLFELGGEGYWELYTSAYAAEEARRNIALKFPDCLGRLEKLNSGLTIVPSGTGRSSPLHLPEKDRPVFEAAVRCRATHLLTGDRKHFGPFMNRADLSSGMLIQTVADFLAHIL
ncbi:MAG: PIN domain-containing protein [Deltaproteobacteria bacterium]|nr:PIN domain-containing protein [Deltaproteobacteria bacterium]